MYTNLYMECRFCGKFCKNKNSLAQHELRCKLNPNVQKHGGRTKGQHYDYDKSSHSQESILYKCEFCGREKVTTYTGNILHQKSCKCNPNKVAICGHKHTNETKRLLSEKMKVLHSEGKAFCWADLSKRKEPSYPEEWFMAVLKNDFGLLENKDYEREVKFYSFSLDFVFPNKKVIEIDGSQHKRSEYQKDCDIRKDEKLKQDGWKELRLDWDFCFNHSSEMKELVKKFLG